MSYQMINLDSEAKKYIVKCLEMGLSLARSILAKHNIETGKVTTCFDNFVDPIRIQQMTADRLSGGLVSDTGLSVDCLIDSIREHLTKSDNNLCILEAASAEPQFPFMEKTSLRYMVHDKEVYFVLASDRCSHKEIDDALGTAQSPWLFIGVMTSVPDPRAWEGKKKLSKEEVEVLATRAEKVFVMAFDEEGYLTWSKDEADKKPDKRG